MSIRSLFGGGGPKFPPDAAQRTPPGQYLTEKWPVLHYGGRPRIDLRTWRFRLWGAVEGEVTLTGGR